MDKPSGFINIKKPAGMTSFGVIARLRKITGVKKIGHAGTLDPMATGVLICAIGRAATREIDKVQGLNKVYQAEFEFGKTSDTYDVEGQVEKVEGAKNLTKATIQKALKKFEGEIKQLPPAFSAKKIKGQPAYILARKGERVELKPAKVNIYYIKILKYSWPKIKVEIKCGKGTYIRSIAHDLGQELGVGAIMTSLKRIEIGPYTLERSVELDEITPENWDLKLFVLPWFV